MIWFGRYWPLALFLLAVLVIAAAIARGDRVCHPILWGWCYR